MLFIRIRVRLLFGCLGSVGGCDEVADMLAELSRLFALLCF